MRSFWFCLFGFALLVLGVLMAANAEHGTVNGPMINSNLPAIDNCSKVAWSAAWTPAFSAPDGLAKATYACDQVTVHVAIAHYLTQHQGKEAASDAHYLYPEDIQDRMTNIEELSLADDLVVKTASYEGAESWTWYATGAKTHASQLGAKLEEARLALTFARAPSAVIVLISESEASLRQPIFERISVGLWRWYTAQL